MCDRAHQVNDLYLSLDTFASNCYINLQKAIKLNKKLTTEVDTMAILISLIVVGWVAAAVIGTQAYFRGEQTKPIHERNWRSEGFEKIAVSVTAQATDYSKRTPAYGMDAYSSQTLPSE